MAAHIFPDQDVELRALNGALLSLGLPGFIGTGRIERYRLDPNDTASGRVLIVKCDTLTGAQRSQVTQILKTI